MLLVMGLMRPSLQQLLLQSSLCKRFLLLLLQEKIC
jgi:hypothetical protein